MNMKSFLLLIFCVLLASFAAEGQGWERIYSDPAFAPDARVVKVWPVAGGNFLLLIDDYDGSSDDLFVAQVDQDGGLQWIRPYDFGEKEKAIDLIPTMDGGYAMLYQISVPGITDTVRPVLVKLDAQFDVEFRVNVGEQIPQYAIRTSKLLETASSYWIVASKFANQNQTGFSIELDHNGIVTSSQGWGVNSLSQTFSTPINSNGEWLAVGIGHNFSINSNETRYLLYNNSGGVVWEKSIPGTLANGGGIAPDGGFMMVTSNKELYKISDQGDVLWQKLLPQNVGVDVISYELVIPTFNGDGYWIVGFGDNTVDLKIILLRTDLQGEVLYSNVFGLGGTFNIASSLAASSDDGCIIGGMRDGVPYLIKVDSQGVAYASGISGQLTTDFDGDCIGNIAGFGGVGTVTIKAWQNSQLLGSVSPASDGQYYMALPAGDYQVLAEYTINPAFVFCPDTISLTVLPFDTVQNVDITIWHNPQPIDSVFGYAFHDIDGDCHRDSFETGGYEGWPVYLYIGANGVLVFIDTVLTGLNGYYVFDNLLGVTNEMFANLIIPGPPSGSGLLCHFFNCPLEEVFNFSSGTSYQSNIGFQCDSLPPCPLIEVDIATNQIRPCSTSIYQVHYCNIGVEAASDAYVEVTFDTGLNVTASSIPWSSVNGNTYTFDLGNLASGQCGDFNVTVLASCDDPAGTTYCAEAHAFPDTCSLAPGANWDGSQIEVTAECTGDSVIFTIQNVGTGDMQGALEYIVIEDNVLLMQGDFELGAGEQIQIAYAADGAFFHLSANQSPGFPGLNTPIAWAEGCGGNGNVSLGFLNQYPLGDEDVWLDVFCLQSVNSYDPNDKQGFPLGYADEHFIEQNIDIEYLIRFQNTGTAPAYQVEIRDTIPVQWLDPTTLRPGASSHDYEWDIQGNGVVVFKFPNIVLPDSNANFDASQGFVKFRVSQRKDVPLGTKIENLAAIYFDFNPPIITNQTLHTVGEKFILVKTNTPLLPNLQVKIVPNPARDRVRVQLDGLEKGNENLVFVLYSAVGQPVLRGIFNSSNFEFQAGQLPQGVYFYEIRQEGKLAATGKIVKM